MAKFNLEQLKTRVRKRLAVSASGYISTKKLSIPDRAAMMELIKAGDVEIFESPTGRAYRFTKKPAEGTGAQ